MESGVLKHDPFDVMGGVERSRFYARFDAAAIRGSGDAATGEPRPTLRCVGTGASESGVSAVLEASGRGNDRAYDVVYTCYERGSSLCKLSFDFQFWRGVELAWTKTCGGGARQDVIVESDLGIFETVFSHGLADKSWSASHPAITLLGDQDDVTFTVRRDPKANSDDPLVLKGVSATFSQPDVLGVDIGDASIWAGRVLAEVQDRATLRVHHDCHVLGDALVTIKVQTEDKRGSSHGARRPPPERGEQLFDPIVFSYVKRCSGGLGLSVIPVVIGGWLFLCACSGAIAAGIVVKKSYEDPYRR